MPTDLKQLRSRLDATGPRSRGRRYPSPLQKDVVAWAHDQRAAGMTTAAIAEKLGVPWTTIARWSSEPGPAFREVELVAPASAPSSSAVLRSPRGYVVEGLDVAVLAELLARLG